MLMIWRMCNQSTKLNDVTIIVILQKQVCFINNYICFLWVIEIDFKQMFNMQLPSSALGKPRLALSTIHVGLPRAFCPFCSVLLKKKKSSFKELF